MLLEVETVTMLVCTILNRIVVRVEALAFTLHLVYIYLQARLFIHCVYQGLNSRRLYVAEQIIEVRV